MPVISDKQAKALAGSIKSIGGVTNYGGGSGETYHHVLKYAPDASTKHPSQNLLTKLGNVGKETLNIGKTVVGAAAKYVAHTAQDVGQEVAHTAETVMHSVVDPVHLQRADAQTEAIGHKVDSVIAAYKAGQMSKRNYQATLKELGGAYSDINKGTLNSILSEPTPTQQAENLIETAGDFLTLGRVSTLKALAKRGVEDVAKTGLDKSLGGVAGKVSDLFTKVPAFRNLIERNAAAFAKQLPGESFGQALTRNGKQIALGLLIKRPVFVQQNITDTKAIYEDMTAGKYGAAARTLGFQATQLLEGGPLGAFISSGRKVFGTLGKLSYGSGSVIDTLSRQIGNGKPEQIANYLTALGEDSTEFKDTEKILRVLQETNLRTADEDVNQAVVNVLHNYDVAGIDRGSITPAQLVQDYQNWYEAAQTAKLLGTKGVKGLKAEEARNLVVVRWDSVMKRGLANAVAAAGDDRNAMAGVISHFADQTTNSWANNPTLMAHLTRIVDEAGSAEEAARRIKSIPTALAIPKNIPKRVADRLAKLGYGLAVPEGGVRRTPIVEYEDTRKLISKVTGPGDTSHVFDPTIDANPIMAGVATGLEKAGLSPRSAAQVANQKLSESVVANLETTNAARALGFVGHVDGSGKPIAGGRVILSKLQKYVNDLKPSSVGNFITAGKGRPALTDIRQMTSTDIMKALSVTRSEAKDVSKAIMKGYTEVPLEVRGLGDKLVDYAYRFNPLEKYYTRIQSAFRYSYNPFFATQEAFETSAFAGLQGGNRATNLVDHHLLWRKSKDELDTAVKTLDDSGIFTSSLPGEAAQDQVLGRLTADITQSQKRDLAGLALNLAKAQGKTLEEVARDNPDQIADALRVIVQYPQHGALASPLARTLNIAFFPMRYNIKVAGLAAQVLSKQPPSVQLAVTKSLFDFKDWLKSDEGIAWQSKNTDALQLFNWISPLNNIAGVFNTLNFIKNTVTGEKGDPIGNIGQLGGLPFGLITQLLDSQGIINLNSPYVMPSTGDVLPKHIPDTTKARAAVALQDLLGSLFTYPGRILGLPGKQQTINNVVRSFVDTHGTDFIKQDQLSRLTPLEQAWVRVLKGDTSSEALDNLYQSPMPNGFQGYTIPPFNIPKPLHVESRSSAAKKSGSKGKRVKPTAKPIGTF